MISQGENTIDKTLSDLYEDVHWIILISGNILTLVGIVTNLKYIFF